MLDQMFTAENFRRIYDKENRKGVDLATRYFPNLAPHTLSIRDKVYEIRAHKAVEAKLKPADFRHKLKVLKDELATLKEAKSIAIDEAMEAVSIEVLRSSFKIELSPKIGPKNKPIFCVDQTPHTFFVVKQLQHNIHRIYKVKQANRNNLVRQVRDTIRTRFPLELVRTDISSFYESINRKTLLDKLELNQLLSASSKKYIKQVLESYGSISATTNGIPRGVGISAYLAELYLESLDKAICNLSGLVLYCRYVDDIVAIFARPPAGKDPGSYKARILDIFAEKELTSNPQKTFEIDLVNGSNRDFEYLGYRFIFNQGNWEIHVSSNKIANYETRLKLTFKEYEKQSSVDTRGSYRDIVARIKFLTGNTRLSNSKSQATTGIYYNNSIVSDLVAFKKLDQLLNKLIRSIKRPSLRKRLKPFTFTEGFQTRRFHNFSSSELQKIVKAWKHA